MDWVSPRSIKDMMVVSYRGLGNTRKGKVLWSLSYLALMWTVWTKRKARIFEDQVRSP